jgi:isoleucyl-tRNA synthetase
MDDYQLGRQEGLPVIQLVDPRGLFTAGCGAYAGRFIKEADEDLIQDLKRNKVLLRRETCRHPYPFCWRCDTPLIQYARGGWFIQTTGQIGRIIANNQAIRWLPENIRDGRFGNFLETNVDWALSRERYWGTPLPIWICQGCGAKRAMGSLKELHGQEGVEGHEVFQKARSQDPSLNEHLAVHKPWIDAVTFACGQCGSRMRRVSEVVDCWYDSGAMPFAQWGYPHKAGSEHALARAFPADFISEAIDQTRGWFYSLLALSSLLFEGHAFPHPYRTCLVLGHVCDEKGEKMSKHKRNYIDPAEILREEGADALRWFFYSCDHPWTSARFSRASVREAQKEFLLRIWNVYSFFTIYANIDLFDPAGREAQRPEGAPWYRTGRALKDRPELDRWILSELQGMAGTMVERLEAYDVFGAAGILSAFLEGLSNWYVQRTRDRFWRSWRSPNHSDPLDLDKLDAYGTLYECLVTLARALAPFVPFLAESLWGNLARRPFGERVPESVHLADYPLPEGGARDEALASEMALIREIVSLGRGARTAQKLKVRLPLPRLILILADPSREGAIQRQGDLLREALNVKALEVAGEASPYVSYQVKPNFRLIGSKYRSLVPGIKKALAGSDAAALRAQVAREGSCRLTVEGQEVVLGAEEIEVSLLAREGFAAAGGGGAVVVLDTHVTPELMDEGFARELISRINRFRSNLDLKFEQHIDLAIKGSARLEAIARAFSGPVRGETLAENLIVGQIPPGWKSMALEGEQTVEGEAGWMAIQPR